MGPKAAQQHFKGVHVMKKKLVCLLTAAMSISLLAGCGSTAATTASSAAPAASSAVESTAAAGSSSAAATASTAAAATDGDLADKKVGVCIYQFSDNFMTMFRNELESYLESKGFKKENINIVDGANDQATQTNQIQNFITSGVDVLIINPVNSSSAATITEMVVKANIPLVYINREPDQDEEKRWEENKWNVCYVGCDARQSGTFQGEMIADLGIDKLDMNKNGKIDYVMIEGDPENVDAQYRTEYSIKALTDKGLEVNKLDDEVGNWDQATATQQSLTHSASMAMM